MADKDVLEKGFCKFSRENTFRALWQAEHSYIVLPEAVLCINRFGHQHLNCVLQILYTLVVAGRQLLCGRDTCLRLSGAASYLVQVYPDEVVLLRELVDPGQ